MEHSKGEVRFSVGKKDTLISGPGVSANLERHPNCGELAEPPRVLLTGRVNHSPSCKLALTLEERVVMCLCAQRRKHYGERMRIKRDKPN